ncbi:MAG: hypothetical protein ABIZ05_15935 [Pseudonocardiaceae bacterium]
MDGGGRRQHLRRTAHPQHSHRQIGSVGYGEQPGGPHALTGQQPEPALRRCQQDHPTAGPPLVPRHLGSLEFRSYHHPLGVRLLAAVARGGDRRRVTAQVRHHCRHRAPLGGHPQRMMRDLPGLRADHERHSGGHRAHRENRCRAGAQRRNHGNHQAPHTQRGGGQGPEIQPGQRHTPADDRRRHQAQVMPCGLR